MTAWPNWIDLVLVTILLRTCYSGYGRGFFAEALNLLGIVTATALACNYHEPLARMVSPWWRGDPAGLAFLLFLTLLLATLVLSHVAFRKLTDLIKWERVHWTTQWLGLAFGAIRGLWWSGLLLKICLAVGVPYLEQSVQERSRLVPYVMPISTQGIEWVVDAFPGRPVRKELIPSMKLKLPRLPEELRSETNAFGARTDRRRR